MNIIVIGLGSMGKRRVRLLHEMFPEYAVFGVDGREDRRTEAEKLLGISCFSSLDSIEENIDCAFVCTSPLSHADIITECLEHKWNVFTEINLIDKSYEKNIELAGRNNCKLFLSSTFFYREEIKYIRSYIANEGKWNYIYHIGQYLPDWHPWENYTDFFVGDKRTNGCREILAIELPWLLKTFGEVESTSVISDKMTGLNIGFHDNYLICMTHKNGDKGILVVDVVSPCAVRIFEAYSEGKYISWEGTPESIKAYDPIEKATKSVSLIEKAEHADGYRAFIVENAYKNEIREFFDVVLNGKQPVYGFEQDQEVLKLIDSLGA